MCVIELEALSKWYGEVIGLNSITVEIQPGTTIVVREAAFSSNAVAGRIRCDDVHRRLEILFRIGRLSIFGVDGAVREWFVADRCRVTVAGGDAFHKAGDRRDVFFYVEVRSAATLIDDIG